MGVKINWVDGGERDIDDSNIAVFLAGAAEAHKTIMEILSNRFPISLQNTIPLSNNFIDDTELLTMGVVGNAMAKVNETDDWPVTVNLHNGRTGHFGYILINTSDYVLPTFSKPSVTVVEDEAVRFGLTITKEARTAVRAKTGGKCVYCNTDLEPDFFHVDHIVAKAKGGTNDFANLIPACQMCNGSKSDRSLLDFMEQMRGGNFQGLRDRIAALEAENQKLKAGLPQEPPKLSVVTGLFGTGLAQMPIASSPAGTRGFGLSKRLAENEQEHHR